MLNKEYAVIAILMVFVCIAAMNTLSSDDEAWLRPAPVARSLARAARPPRVGGAAPPPPPPAAPPAHPPVVVVPRAAHPGDPGANDLLLGAAGNAIGHEARALNVADAHFDNLVIGERRRAQAWEDVTLGRLSAWRGLAVAAIVIGGIAVLVLVWLGGKSYSEPTTAPTSYALPASSGPTSVVIASPSPAPATVTCGTMTSPCPPAVNICQRQGSESGIRACCGQISDTSQRELCVALTNSRLALR